MDSSLVDDVRSAIADVMNTPLESVAEDATPETIESWDSMSHLNLVLSLEQTFGVSFAPEEITELTSVAAIVGAVRKKRP